MADKSTRRAAFTLVELLVVIAIIGVLVALLLPAVQAAREAARRAQCSNQLRQVAVAWQLHHDAHKFFPSGGWGYAWIGDPDRGAGKKQSGSWAYSCLPFLEANAIYQMGKGATGTAKRDALTELARTPLAVFYCPSRRSPRAYNNADVGLGPNINYNFGNPDTLARSDYAANLGPRAAPSFGDPPNISSQWGSGPNPTDAAQGKGFIVDTFDAFRYIQGVAYQRSQIELKHITDGASNTYMVGEKYVNPDFYEGGRPRVDSRAKPRRWPASRIRTSSPSTTSARTRATSTSRWSSSTARTSRNGCAPTPGRGRGGRCCACSWPRGVGS
jgi:prepilin-type N-terminal cleavage/methylation domain-containing protein